MSMPAYPVLCYAKACTAEAAYKVASRWSDGITGELKTYSLACEKCLPALFRDARKRSEACRLSAGETLDSPGIYLLKRGSRDLKLARREDLESRFAGGK